MSDLFAYPPRCMSREEAARYMGISITTFDELATEGTYPIPKKVKAAKKPEY
ncbi:hypothetical protein [Rhizobium gallicum]|uniref:hypothetical protein n=1 Tax=Rhizobium gallicum TaxID=56730 RepID=UPI001EF86F1D|nr:hypothetical protein [Rhizobium gallicum]ULJ70632.1 hypothetical protein L2W42_11740 [Rhizobium gallicum]